MLINYDPWEDAFKQPFGAVKTGQKVSFMIEIAKVNVQQVQLCLEEDFRHQTTQITLSAKQPNRYYGQVTLTAGLYFYYFKIHYQDQQGPHVIYYGRNGCQSSIQQLSKYQQTVVKKTVAQVKSYQQGVCYQIFPDSFYQAPKHHEHAKANSLIYGKKTDLPMYVKNSKGEILRWTFYGGNLRGITAKIPYLKALGVDWLYLNPIFEATSSHRYDTNDYFKIDELLGTQQDFDHLVHQLHANQMHLILDGVFDHVGANSRYFNKNGLYGTTQGAYQNQQSPYYSWFTFNHYPNDYQCWWGAKDLPQIKKSSHAFHDFIAGEHGVLAYWNQHGVDGWRLDVADELSDDFIKQIRNRLTQAHHQILLGEVWEDASNKISYGKRRQYVYGNELDGTMNYPFRKGIIQLLNQQQIVQTAQKWMHLYENYPRNYMLNCLNNIGTHDTVRIKTALGGQVDKLKIAIGLLFMFPGVPCIYYGDEVGLEGETDPANRAFYPWKKENWQIYEIYHKWIKRRKTLTALQSGDLTLVVWKSVIGIVRYTPHKKVIYLANCSAQSVKLTPDKLVVYHQQQRFKPELIKYFGNQVISGFGEKYLKKTE